MEVTWAWAGVSPPRGGREAIIWGWGGRAEDPAGGWVGAAAGGGDDFRVTLIDAKMSSMGLPGFLDCSEGGAAAWAAGGAAAGAGGAAAGGAGVGLAGGVGGACFLGGSGEGGGSEDEEDTGLGCC